MMKKMHKRLLIIILFILGFIISIMCVHNYIVQTQKEMNTSKELYNLIEGVWNSAETDVYIKNHNIVEPSPYREVNVNGHWYIGYGDSIVINPIKNLPGFYALGGSFIITAISSEKNDALCISLKGEISLNLLIHFLDDNTIWFEVKNSQKDKNKPLSIKPVPLGPQNTYLRASLIKP